MERIQQRKITRHREFRACTECRRRKLRCNRQQPCSSCARRNEILSCIYEAHSDGTQSGSGHRLQAEARLEHLEQLVKEISQSRGASTNQDRSTDVASVQPSTSGLPNQSQYVGATHWSAMLDDIEELRNAVTAQEDSDDADIGSDSNEVDGIGILFGTPRTLSSHQIISRFLPPRHEADQLVASYFRNKAVAAPFIHTAHFSRLYQSFWDNPATASPLWVSILFSILNVAAQALSTVPNTDSAEATKTSKFAIAAVNFLVVGEYFRPQRFAVEALLLYIHARCILGLDMSPQLAIIFGTLVRLATVMGYHKEDERARPNISAFEMEMRRRAWSLCMQLDMLISFQLGLPSNIQFPTWNTRPPTNLLDSDFDEDTVQLPPARPDSDPTELLFYIAKHRIMAIFERIVRHTLSATHGPNIELDVMDQELRDTYTALPAVLKPRSMTDSVVDSPFVIVTRLCVHFIYQKSLCVLHRRHITCGRTKSVNCCYDAASSLVRQFVDIYKEFEPGGQLETERWFMESITWHDFLLGCAALCLTMCSTRQKIAAPTNEPLFVDITESVHLLQEATAVFQRRSSASGDTQKVLRLVNATILKFSTNENTGVAMTQSFSFTNQQVWSDNMLRQMTLPSYNDEQWLWNENTNSLTDNTTWAFMEEFLNLPTETSTTNV